MGLTKHLGISPLRISLLSHQQFLCDTVILHFTPPVSFKHLIYTLSASLPNILTVHLAHQSLCTSSDHGTLCLDAYSQRGLVRERDTPCRRQIFTLFSLFGFGQNYHSYLNIHQSTRHSFSWLFVPIQYRTGRLPRQSTMINTALAGVTQCCGQ